MNNLVVIIPTKNRPDLLQNSLKSIASQTKKPDIAIVVSDCDRDHFNSTKAMVDSVANQINVELLHNQRTRNLSGAINTALSNLLTLGYTPEETYIALLDDDDYWDPNYLKMCLTSGEKSGADWVVSGLIWHESPKDPGKSLSIPQNLEVDDFLVSNPHIQGSNLFIRFSKLLEAGGFDEALDSTTDRDVCIRLLDLGDIKYSILNEHLVHHCAYSDMERLSQPGSDLKRKGLTAFYRKYMPRMSPKQKKAFKERAVNLFQCEISDDLKNIQIPRIERRANSQIARPFPIIVGFIATRMDSTEGLLSDLSRLSGDTGLIAKVVITDNTIYVKKLRALISSKKFSNLDIMLKDKDQIESDSNEGMFGSYFIEKKNRKGISAGRTVLHHYIYKEARKIPNSVVWVLDDDIRLKYTDFNGTEREIEIWELQNTILELKQRSVSIGIGEVTGDPPLPALSMVRTQLLDLFYNLIRFERQQEDLTKFNIFNMRTNREYYYDFSDRCFSHLETPFWFNKELSNNDRAEKAILQEVTHIEFGKAVFRPIISLPREDDLDESEGIIVRGGNALVLNLESLRHYPNISPRIGDVASRRGDTLWCILNKHLGGCIIEKFPIPVTQVRTLENRKRFDVETLISDFYGSSYVKAINDFYNWKKNKGDTISSRLRLYHSEEDIQWIIVRFKEHLEKKLNQFALNSYRIRGLINSLEKNENIDLHKILAPLKEIFRRDNVVAFLNRAANFYANDIRMFLSHFKDYTKSYRERLPKEFSKIDINNAIERTREITENPDIQYLSHGMEGVISSDGKYAYKYFYKGTLNFRPGQLEFIKEKLEGNRNLNHIAHLHKVFEKDGEVVFKMELLVGDPYNGGLIREFRRLLQECDTIGLAYRNMHPKNIMVNGNLLKICDLGRSIVPLTEEEYREMAKRAYMAYRFHFREDLAEVMSMSLFTEEIPELYGFEYFWESLKKKTKHELMDYKTIELVSSINPSKILDYGCGKGAIAEQLSEMGFNVTGFDIDEEIIKRNKIKDNNVQYINYRELEQKLNAGGRFDTIICSMVFCTIHDNEEVESVLENIRKLISVNGEVIITLCNPFFTFVKESEAHVKKDIPKDNRYSSEFKFNKVVKETGGLREEMHRPFSTYKKIFLRNGFEIKEVNEVDSIDCSTLAPSSDFIILHLRPVNLPPKRRVSLLIKASPMEWETIDFQIRHIVNQLDTPKQFMERIVITDRHEGPFLRQYTEPNQEAFQKKIDQLKNEGLIDKIIYAHRKEEKINKTYQKWFGLKSTKTHAQNGQHTYTTLYGIEQCKGDYILQLDSDCLICRKDLNHDYVGDMISVYKQDPNALTVAFNIANKESRDYTYSEGENNWRTEVRFSLFNRKRLMSALPLPNSCDSEGIIQLSWHRAMDRLIDSSHWRSYRGGDARTFFIHVPNEFKKDPNKWYNIVREVERSHVPEIQYGHVDLQGTLEDWLEGRNENFVFIVRGRNVHIPKLKRAIDSITRQSIPDWGMVIIDASSTNPMAEYIEHVVLKDLKDKITYFRNWKPITPMENTKIAISNLCSNPESVIITVDADDALTGEKVLEKLKNCYSSGADLTVGSMLRTDKYKDYPVDFANPRKNRGGNVWQHLRTFKKALFDSIDIDYFKVDGDWVPNTEDWAFMLPMVEIAKSPQHIRESLYFYEPSDDKAYRSIEAREELIGKIIQKPSLKVI